MIIKHLISMMRPGNSIMAAVGIIVGYLFSGNNSPSALPLLILAGAVSLGYGNVINDLYDIETDKIAHPERALPSGKVTIAQVKIFATFLVIIALALAFLVSPLHGVATLAPIILLTIYAMKLKGTPLAGNIIVSLLVAYTMIYGALNGRLELAAIPAILAFLTNMIREITKDCADKDGDSAAGIITTAHLETKTINRIVYTLMFFAMISSFLPALFPEFRVIYPLGILLIVVPLQIIGTVQFAKSRFTMTAKIVKLQLLGGLIFFALEGIRYRFIG